MGTVVKYVFYIVLLVVIYLVGRGIYDGNITKETTVGNVVNQVEEGSKEILDDTAQDVRRGYEDVKRNAASAPQRPLPPQPQPRPQP